MHEVRVLELATCQKKKSCRPGDEKKQEANAAFRDPVPDYGMFSKQILPSLFGIASRPEKIHYIP